MVVVSIALLLFIAAAAVGIVPPRQRGALPGWVIEESRDSKNAFRLKRAWIGRKERQLAGDVRYHVSIPALEGMDAESYRALSGVVSVPVLLGLYLDTPEQPAAATALQQEFFDGPWPSGTISD